MLHIFKFDVRKWDGPHSNSSGPWPYIKTVLLSDNVVSPAFVETYDSRLEGEYMKTSKSHVLGDRVCSNIQVDMDLFTSGLDIESAFGASSEDPYSVWLSWKNSAYSWVEPDTEFGWTRSGYFQFVRTNIPIATTVSLKAFCTDGVSPFHVKLYQRTNLKEMFTCKFGSYHLALSGHSIETDTVFSTPATSYRTYFRCYAGGKLYHFDGTIWTTSVSSIVTYASNATCLEMSRTLPADPTGKLNLALQKAALLPFTNATLLPPTKDIPFLGDILSEASRVSRNIVESFQFISPVTSQDLSAASISAINGIQAVSVNSPMLLKELVEIGRTMVGLAHGDFSSMPETLDSAWLSAHYGLRLTINDLRSVVSAIHNTLQSTYTPQSYYKTRARTSPSVHYPPSMGSIERSIGYCVKYALPDSKLLRTMKELMDWDLWPTLQNSWDYIPFSFVVDWFVNVSKVLESIDSRIYEEYIKVLSVIYSVKDVVFPTFSAKYPFTNVCASRYSRNLTSRLHCSPPDNLGGTLSAINIVDGAALIIQCLQ